MRRKCDRLREASVKSRDLENIKCIMLLERVNRDELKCEIMLTSLRTIAREKSFCFDD